MASSAAQNGAGSVPQPTAERAQEIAENLKSINDRIAQASSSRSSPPPRLVAVSKLKPASDIVAALEAGQLHFGENYVQELEDKAKVLPSEVRWHFIGGLQTNKCKSLGAIPNLYVVETVDTAKKARALQKARAGLVASNGSRRRDPLRVYIQVNTSGEDAKSGVALPASIAPSSSPPPSEDDLVSLARLVRSPEECPDLRLAGLMTIGSLTESNTSSHPSSTDPASTTENRDFSRLVQTRTWLAKELGVEEGELGLSMGMSADFEAACRMGSGSVRVGSSVFGERVGKEEAKRIREGEGFAGR